MEVIEDGNIMDRIPILLQRDLEYYQKNQTVLSEIVCPGVVGGRLDFPRNASFAAVKIVIWLEEEFSIAFQHGSGMFVTTGEDNGSDADIIVKTSDPDKFVQLAVKSSDALMEHLHMLVQEALDHADLPVLTATLGAAALLKNSLFCYLQHVEDAATSESQGSMQAAYKRYVTMSEAVAERVLDLHMRVVSLYMVQDAGGRPIEQTARAHHAGSPSVHACWLYMNGVRKDLWDTVPPRMAQRIYAGILNEILTILTTNTTEVTTPLLINDILNILLCMAQLLPTICSSGADLAGLDVKQQARDVRDVHAKCNELFKCLVYRGADLHYIHQAFKEKDDSPIPKNSPAPWFIFVSPKLFGEALDDVMNSPLDLPDKTAIGLELIVLLAQPQPSWPLLVKVLMMRNCQLIRSLLIHAVKHTSIDNSRWPANGCWYTVEDKRGKCEGFLCTADGFCKFKGDSNAGEEYAKAAGAMTFILASIGSKAELKSTLCYALEISARDWAACLDKRQVWCDRRPPWLAAVLALVGTALQFLPPILVNAIQNGASMYQTMSLCLTCISRTLDCVPRTFFNASDVIQTCLPSNVNPVGGSVLLQMLITVAYEELQKWAKREVAKEKAAASESNGQAHNMNPRSRPRQKQVRIMSIGHTNTSSSVSFDGLSTPSSIALGVAEALCSIDEDDKHTQEIALLVERANAPFAISSRFGLQDFPEFAELFQEGEVPGAKAECAGDAAALTSQILMTAPGRDSLRVIYDHLQLHADRIYDELGVREKSDADIPLNKAPLLYIMFHIGRRPFDQYFRGEWPMPWSKLVTAARAWSGIEGARVHVCRREDMRNAKTQHKCNNRLLLDLHHLFKTRAEALL
ncbi:uncharacterized protein LOC126369613 isoform X2 [Pectinophora gossypiella]|uniref:uncharacterized protein LOC126369613 isoform X2 n=1 Tax=Pectinophora gossypiella TaxID=13191 RepID=UPI00214ED3DA|nr:uncharacterized protein LOC126369613 isoform X2 [Pectinophora gossypiella]